MRNGTGFHVPLAASASPWITGGSGPSEQRYHSPSSRIAARESAKWNVQPEATVVLRVCPGSQGQRLLGRVADEEFLSGNADTLAAVPLVNLGSVSPQP